MGVFVVPDSQMPKRPRYGEEVKPQNWQQALGQLSASIQKHRAETPVYAPFPAGTPTLQKQQLQWQKQLQEEQLQAARIGGAAGTKSPATGTKSPATLTERQQLATANLLRGVESLVAQSGAYDPEFGGGLTLNHIFGYLSDPKTAALIKQEGADLEWVLDQVLRRYAGMGLDRYLASTPDRQLPPLLKDIKAKRQTQETSFAGALERLGLGTGL